MLGFTTILTDIIQGLRVAELKLSNLFRKLLCVRVFLGGKSAATPMYRTQLTYLASGNSTTALSPLVTFVVFVITASTTGQTLDTSSAYTALSLIALVGSSFQNTSSLWLFRDVYHKPTLIVPALQGNSSL